MKVQLPHRFIFLWVTTLTLICCTLPAFSQTNTLVTGVITDQHGQMPNDVLDLRILEGKKKLADCKARDGLFAVDLQGLSQPNAEITVVLKPQSFDKGDREKSRSYSEAQASTTLTHAQNIQLKVHFDYEKDHPAVGPYADMPAK